jgi:hypothetical protein
MPNQVPVPVDDLRLRLRVRLAVAPRHWFRGLWKPHETAMERDKLRDDLVDFITQGWEQHEVVVAERQTFDPRQGNLL